MDFDQRSPTQLYSETLSPEMKKAIADKHVTVGMTRDQVKMTLGQRDTNYRQTTKDGVETEDWIYGKPPGKITFVTFAGSKVIAVKETYAGDVAASRRAAADALPPPIALIISVAAIARGYPYRARVGARRPITFAPGITSGDRFIVAIDPNVVRTRGRRPRVISMGRPWRRADCNADTKAGCGE